MGERLDETMNRTTEVGMSKDEDRLKEKKVPRRIPYDSWINSQLSIARHYGGCKVNGKTYKLDRKCKAEANGKYKPDLVEVV